MYVPTYLRTYICHKTLLVLALLKLNRCRKRKIDKDAPPSLSSKFSSNKIIISSKTFAILCKIKLFSGAHLKIYTILIIGYHQLAIIPCDMCGLKYYSIFPTNIFVSLV